MDASDTSNGGFVGRRRELEELSHSLDKAIDGSGSTIVVSGEAGIGKTRLVDEFRTKALKKNFKILSGAALADHSYPFLIFSRALEELDHPIFEEHVYKRFMKLFAVDRNGELIAQASPEGAEDLDADVFAGMVTAVQDFVRDSFDASGGGSAGLGRLEYGEMKVLMEHGQNLFLAVVFKGAEHDDMRRLLKRTLNDIEHGIECTEEQIARLADARFVVRRDLAEVQLDKERLRIADEIHEAVTEMASSGPLLIILEDLHWADESSLFVLNYLARNIRNDRIMMLATTRPEEATALRNTMESMKAESLATIIQLGRLGDDTVSELINTICPDNDFPQNMFENISGQCEGNPFFVTEMMRYMLEVGNVTEHDGKYILMDEEFEIPGTIEDMANRRLEMLEPDAIILAEYASCVGREFDRPVIFSLTSLSDPEGALDKLRKQGLVSMHNGGGEFNHAIFQEVLYKGLGERWKSTYHKSLGEHFEEVYADRPEVVLFELARHFSKTPEKQKAFDYGFRAGEKAEAVFAPEQAIVFYNDSLDSLARIPALKDSVEKKVEIMERLGDLYIVNGEFENAVEQYHTIIEQVEDVVQKANLYTKTANAYHGTGDKDKCIIESDMGIRLLGDKVCREKANLLGSKSWSYIISGETEKAVELLQESASISEKLNDKKAIALANHRIGTCYSRMGKFQEGLDYLKRSLRSREEIGDEYGAALTRVNIGIIYDDRGELEKALDNYEKSRVTFKKMKDKYHLSLLLNNIGVVYEGMGELDRALEHYTEAKAMDEKIGDSIGLINLLGNIGLIYYLKEEPEKALEYFEMSLIKSEKLGSKFNTMHIKRGIAESYILLGDLEKALQNALEAFDISLELGTKAEEAENHRVLGIVHREKENWDQATEEFEQAKALTEEVEVPDKLARVLYEYALLHKIRGEDGLAKEELEHALRILEEKGMKQWIDKAKNALDELDRT